MDQAARIETLEMTIAHQEGLIGELSRQLYEQDQRIERLEALTKTMVARLKALTPSDAGEAPHDSRPPHY